MGGEKKFDLPIACDIEGSPPRGRGKVDSPIYGTPKTRITPAWAGKRRSHLIITINSKDHPRVGGEKKGGKLAPIQHKGSPPRGRGKAAIFL